MSTPSEHRIIVVDDEPIVGKRLKKLLEKEGYTVEAFTRGSHALEELGRNRCDLVITDIMMGNVDGMAILEYTRNNHPDTPVIIITGYGKKEIADEAFRKGVHAFVIKPFKFDELKVIVRNALAGRQKNP